MKSLNGLFLCLFISLSFFSCGQKSAVREETEEAVSIETNEVFTTGDTVEISNRLKVLILPFVDRSDQAKYPGSKTVSTILMNELYGFLYIEPSFDVPEKTNLATMDSSFLFRKELNLSEIYEKYHADVVIYGDYSLQGAKSGPQAQVRLNVWSKASGRIVTNVYKTPIDADIFDAVDEMLSRVIKLTLNEEVKVAYLNFGNFKTGNGNYFLTINNRLAGKITNDSFALNLKIVPNAVYNVKLKNLSDNRVVMNTPVVVKPGEMTNIGYSALGSARLTMTNLKAGEEFHVFLDGKAVHLDETLSNISAGKYHAIKVKDKDHEFTENLYLADGETKKINLPHEKINLVDSSDINAFQQYVWHSPQSSIKVSADPGNITDGRISCYVDYEVPYSSTTYNHAGIGVLGADKMDWTEMNTFKIWIYGTMTHMSYFISLKDKFSERYWYLMSDNWKGWKQIIIPIDSFKPRPYQDNFAKANRIVDYPLIAVEIEMSPYDNYDRIGKFRLIFSDMEVTRE